MGFRSIRFLSVLLVSVAVPICLALVLLSVVLATTSATTAPLGGALASSSQSQPAQARAPTDGSTGPCDWVINIFGEHHIDVCFPIRLIVEAGAGTIRSIFHAVTKQVDFLWSTPLSPFQDNTQGGLISVWDISWGIVLSCVTAVIAWAGLRYAVGSVLSWLSYANLIELIPRLLFALLAAFFSKTFFIMLIQTNNALAGIFNTNALTIIMDQTTTGIISNLMQILYGVLAFVLILEGVARIAVIYLLFAFAPILFFLAGLRETQRWAKNAAVAAVLFIFLQAIQAGTLDVGGRIMTSVLHSKPEDVTFLNLLVAVAIMYITLTLFFSITRMALGRGGDALAATPFMAAAGSLGFTRAAVGAVGNVAGSIRQGVQPLPHPLALQNFNAIALGGNGSKQGGLPPPLSGSGPNGPGPSGPGGPGPNGSGPSGSGASGPPLTPGSKGGNPLSGNWQKTPPIRPARKGFIPSSGGRSQAPLPTHQPLRRPSPPIRALPGPPAPFGP